MAQGTQAKIWDELFRLGLNREMVRRYLKPTKHQMRDIWENPYMCLTFPQFQRLHALVCSHYTLEQLARLIVAREYTSGSEFQSNIRKALAILLTEEGRTHFDEFAKRKSKGRTKEQHIDKRKKFDNNRNAFKRLSNPILEPEENVIEFITEHERLSNQIKPVSSLPDDSVQGPNVSI